MKIIRRLKTGLTVSRAGQHAVELTAETSDARLRLGMSVHQARDLRRDLDAVLALVEQHRRRGG